MKKTWLAAAAAASMLSHVPAAEAFRDTGAQETRKGAFAGLNFKDPLGTREAAKPSARLQLTTSYNQRSPAGLRSYRPAALELGLSGKGRPEMFVGNVRLAETERRLGLSGSNDWILLVALLGAVIVGVVLLTDGSNDLPPEAQQ